MPSGGARARSGPAPDPNALRRDRKDDAPWIVLPAEGYKGRIPKFPLDPAPVYDEYWVGKKRVREFDKTSTEARFDREVAHWKKLWRKPQGVMWKQLGLEHEVASYVRAYLESNEADASAGLKTAVLRMAGEIGLSLPGMHQLRWRIVVDELGARRETRSTTTPGRLSVRDRARQLGAVAT